MTTIKYKGFKILTRPYQLHETRRWTVDLEIRRNGGMQAFSLEERYQTEQEAEERCSGLGRRIIDGQVPGWSVDHLQASRRGSVVLWGGLGGTIFVAFVGAVVLLLLLRALRPAWSS